MKTSGWWLKASAALLDWVFPPRCAICNAPDGWLCRECEDKIDFVPALPNAPEMQVLGAPPAISQQLDAFRAVAYHRGVMRAAIHKLKYEGVRVLGPVLGDIMYAYWCTSPVPIDLVVPVPLHRRRLRQRGYNQSELLAKTLSERMGVPLIPHALQRLRHTSPQVGLDARQRRTNVAGAFECAGEQIKGGRVLLIDDVCTTGSTLAACAFALHRQGVASVAALTLARAGNDHSDW